MISAGHTCETDFAAGGQYAGYCDFTCGFCDLCRIRDFRADCVALISAGNNTCADFGFGGIDELVGQCDLTCEFNAQDSRDTVDGAACAYYIREGAYSCAAEFAADQQHRALCDFECTTCAAAPCDTSDLMKPEHGQFGVVCSGSPGAISSGTRCDLECDVGYTLSEQPVCARGNLSSTTASCTLQTCDVSGVTRPVNGQWGATDCAVESTTIGHGMSCDLECDVGYTLSEQPVCSGTSLSSTTARCVASVSAPQESRSAAVVSSSTVVRPPAPSNPVLLLLVLAVGAALVLVGCLVSRCRARAKGKSTFYGQKKAEEEAEAERQHSLPRSVSSVTLDQVALTSIDTELVEVGSDVIDEHKAFESQGAPDIPEAETPSPYKC